MKVVAVVATTITIGCAPASSAITYEQQCRAMHWPMPLPSVVGWGIDHLMSDSILGCLETVSAIAPDGHDVMDDKIGQAPGSWRMTSVKPPEGSMVTMDTPITVTVVRDYNAPT